MNNERLQSLYGQLDYWESEEVSLERENAMKAICHEIVGILMDKGKGCDMFKRCRDKCNECLFNTLQQSDDIDNNILYNSDNNQYDPDDGEYNFI